LAAVNDLNFLEKFGIVNPTATHVVGKVHSSAQGQDERILCSVGANRRDLIFKAVTLILSAFMPCW